MLTICVGDWRQKEHEVHECSECSFVLRLTVSLFFSAMMRLFVHSFRSVGSECASQSLRHEMHNLYFISEGRNESELLQRNSFAMKHEYSFKGVVDFDYVLSHSLVDVFIA